MESGSYNNHFWDCKVTKKMKAMFSVEPWTRQRLNFYFLFEQIEMKWYALLFQKQTKFEKIHVF